MATAAAMLAPTLGLSSAATKVAMPSGKLWSAMAAADSIPILMRCASGRRCISSTRCTSCGFSAAGTRRSMRAVRPIPPKKARTATQAPGRVPSSAARPALASARISTKDT